MGSKTRHIWLSYGCDLEWPQNGSHKLSAWIGFAKIRNSEALLTWSSLQIFKAMQRVPKSSNWAKILDCWLDHSERVFGVGKKELRYIKSSVTVNNYLFRVKKTEVCCQRLREVYKTMTYLFNGNFVSSDIEVLQQLAELNRLFGKLKTFIDECKICAVANIKEYTLMI